MVSFDKKIKKLKFWEFVSLAAFTMSLVSLSIDAILPAFAKIGEEFGIAGTNAPQLTISLFFLGFAFGQIIYGPLSDSMGRKPPIYAGFIIFIIGSLVSFFAGSFKMLLVGRVLQGLGAAGPRTIILSVVRDQYEGDLMARVMSFAMTVFILVPIIAPTMGQMVLAVAGWRFIFVVTLLLVLINFFWFALRQPETLHEEYRGEFSVKWIFSALREFFACKTAFGYAVISGIMGGCFLGYINTAQQIYQEMYLLGDKFPLFFATIAIALGCASLTNAGFVMRFGMFRIASGAMIMVCLLSSSLFAVALSFSGKPPLWLLMIFLIFMFFCVGLFFGNINALAMQPLGKIAGMGVAVVGFIVTLLQFLLGTLIGQLYNGTIIPLIGSFAVCSFLSIWSLKLIRKWE
jgi:DHA1 family bicyclomycin/chloramphenicol resistance-like MFS transporter